MWVDIIFKEYLLAITFSFNCQVVFPFCCPKRPKLRKYLSPCLELPKDPLKSQHSYLLHK